MLTPLQTWPETEETEELAVLYTGHVQHVHLISQEIVSLDVFWKGYQNDLD